MNVKNKIIDFVIFFLGGGIVYTVFLLFFTKIVDQRSPVIQEFIPLTPLFLICIFLIYSNKD